MPRLTRATAIAPLAALLLLGGCISFCPKTPPTLFDLTAESPAPAGAGQSGSLSSALVVETPEAPLELDVTRVAVQIDPSNVAYVKKAGWVERPARLFGRLRGCIRNERLVLGVRRPHRAERQCAQQHQRRRRLGEALA